MENDQKLNQFQRNLNNLTLLGFLLPKKCEKAINVVYCHHYFPRCDSTSDSYKAQTLCKETCQYFINACSPQLKTLNLLSLGNFINITNCTNFPRRNAGQSPECFYFKESDDENGKLHIMFFKQKYCQEGQTEKLTNKQAHTHMQTKRRKARNAYVTYVSRKFLAAFDNLNYNMYDTNLYSIMCV